MHRNGKELQSICESFMKNTMDFYDIPGISARRVLQRLPLDGGSRVQKL